MVTINMLRTQEGKWDFSGNRYPICDHDFDLVKSPKHVKSQRLLLTCAPISELPSNVSAMDCLH